MLVLAMTVTSLGAPGVQAATKSKNYVSPYEGKKYVLLNAPKDKMDEIIEVLPGMKSPTITPLADGNWVSVQSVIAEKHFWEIIGKLKSLGAEGILVLPIEKMIL